MLIATLVVAGAALVCSILEMNQKCPKGVSGILTAVAVLLLVLPK